MLGRGPAVTAVCPECLCDAPLHAASCSSAPLPRRREVDWPATLAALAIVFLLARCPVAVGVAIADRMEEQAKR